jgi:hypothetical protein
MQLGISDKKINRMKAIKEGEVFTTDLRKILKVIIQKEFEQLPETLKKLEPKERLNILCKLMPFVFPKVEAVEPTDGETMVW